MNFADVILVILIAFLVFLALRKIYRDRKNGSCCSGGCSQCSGCDKKTQDRGQAGSQMD